MANEEVRALLIRVNATTELLRSQLISAERTVGGFAQRVEQQGARVDSTFKKVGQSAGAQRAGLQQLSYQIGDVATMYALGARPMQIFASQSGQVLQAVQLATGGTSRLAAFLGGPWGIAMVAGITALTPFISSLFDTADAADTARGALESLTSARRKEAAERNKPALAQGEVDRMISERGALRSKIAKAEAIVRSGFDSTAEGRAARQGGIARLKSQEAALSRQISEGERVINAARAAQKARFAGGGWWGSGDSDNEPKSSRTGGGRTPRVRSAGRVRGAGISAAAKDVFDPVALAKDTSDLLINSAAEFEQRMNEVREDDLQQQLEIAGRVHDANVEFAEQAADKARRAAEQQIGFLATLYQRAFQGGTKAIWRDFKDIGLAVIGQLLARFTAARVSGGGFDFGTALSASLSSILGFADGGRPPVGRASMVGERGPELFVPDVAGTIIPNGGFGGGGVSVTINAPGATAETVAMIRREIAGASPLIIAAAQSRTTRAISRPRI